MKRLLIIAALLALPLIASPVLAFDIPTQGTANATDTIIWHGDTANISITSANLTITSGTITITDFETAVTAASEAGAQIIADEYESIGDVLLLILLAVAVNALAFWQRNVFLYLVAAPLNLVYGLNLAAGETVNSAMWVAGIIVAIIGVFCIFRAVVDGLLPVLRRQR